jgi:hypothetical protein
MVELPEWVREARKIQCRLGGAPPGVPGESYRRAVRAKTRTLTEGFQMIRNKLQLVL